MEVGELVFRDCQNQNRFGSAFQIGQIEIWIEADSGDDLIQIVERTDGGKLPLKFLQNQKFPILKKVEEKTFIKGYFRKKTAN